MANLYGFDARTVEPAQDFKPLPAGHYLMKIVASTTTINKKGTGSYLALTFEVLDGEHRGRKCWHNLNLDNPNNTAVQIARGELSAICRAVGILTPGDSVELHNLPMAVSVKVTKDQYGNDRNELKGFAAPSSAAMPSQPPTSTPPWKRG